MTDCIKLKTEKYTLRNSPPYPANECKDMRKKGNDGTFYLSHPDKNKTYKWVKVNKNKTLKNKPTKKDLQILVKKYEVTKSGSNLQVAERLAKVKGHIIKKKADIKIIEHFLKTPIKSKHFKFIPLKM
jgi:hypothetical protein